MAIALEQHKVDSQDEISNLEEQDILVSSQEYMPSPRVQEWVDYIQSIPDEDQSQSKVMWEAASLEFRSIVEESPKCKNYMIGWLIEGDTSYIGGEDEVSPHLEILAHNLDILRNLDYITAERLIDAGFSKEVQKYIQVSFSEEYQYPIVKRMLVKGPENIDDFFSKFFSSLGDLRKSRTYLDKTNLLIEAVDIGYGEDVLRNLKNIGEITSIGFNDREARQEIISHAKKKHRRDLKHLLETSNVKVKKDKSLVDTLRENGDSETILDYLDVCYEDGLDIEEIIRTITKNAVKPNIEEILHAVSKAQRYESSLFLSEKMADEVIQMGAREEVAIYVNTFNPSAHSFIANKLEELGEDEVLANHIGKFELKPKELSQWENKLNQKGYTSKVFRSMYERYKQDSDIVNRYIEEGYIEAVVENFHIIKKGSLAYEDGFEVFFSLLDAGYKSTALEHIDKFGDVPYRGKSFSEIKGYVEEDGEIAEALLLNFGLETKMLRVYVDWAIKERERTKQNKDDFEKTILREDRMVRNIIREVRGERFTGDFDPVVTSFLLSKVPLDQFFWPRGTELKPGLYQYVEDNQKFLDNVLELPSSDISSGAIFTILSYWHEPGMYAYKRGKLNSSYSRQIAEKGFVQQVVRRHKAFHSLDGTILDIIIDKKDTILLSECLSIFSKFENVSDRALEYLRALLRDPDFGKDIAIVEDR